jgi:ribonucleoside-diphosphate reductase beta chain
MMKDAVECELQFAQDLLGAENPGDASRVIGLGLADMRDYLGHVADIRLAALGMPKHFNTKNPFGFMDLQDVQELANFFERRVSAYQVGVSGDVVLDGAF